MRLRARVLWIFSTVAILVMLVIVSIAPMTIHSYSLEVATKESTKQLEHIDFALSLIINEISHSVQNLSENNFVRNTDDANFTNFLNASADSFVYNISSPEQAIIDIFRNYGGAHLYVNSVYMGRENGAFVRAYPRDSPTAYDPRERPWYILAKENPGHIMITAPYKSVTNDDMNIGVVTALIDDVDQVYGVVGIDITLVGLTNYLSGMNSVWGGDVFMTDGAGTILVARDQSLVDTNVTGIMEGKEDAYLRSASGMIALADQYVVYQTSPTTGWKISVFIPNQEIDHFTTGITIQIILFALFALILLSTIVALVLDRTVVKPISDLTKVTDEITRTGRLDQDVQIKAGGEIGRLARSFRGMLDKLRQEDAERGKALARIDDNLEQLAALNDQIRNPLAVIMAVMAMDKDSVAKERVMRAVKDIDGIVTSLDHGWEESSKVRRFLKKHGHIDRGEADEDDPNSR